MKLIPLKSYASVVEMTESLAKQAQGWKKAGHCYFFGNRNSQWNFGVVWGMMVLGGGMYAVPAALYSIVMYLTAGALCWFFY